MVSQAVPNEMQRSVRDNPSPFRAAWSLGRREVIRFVRQRNRVIGAIGQPVVFWLLFGAGMNRTFHLPGQDFRQYFAPGTLVLILLFTSIFATISLIEDRQEGFLQSVLVAPLPRWSLVAGKVGGGAFLAVAQGLLFLGLSCFVGVRLGFAVTAALFLLIVLSAIALTCVGFVIAWRLDSTQGFHAIMNLLLVPTWLLSGAFFPIPPLAADARWGEVLLHGLMRVNPLTYAVSGVRQLMYRPWFAASHQSGTEPLWLPGLPACWFVTIGFAVLMFLVAARVARRPTTGDLL
jgi:ABC-2 type transport system permease protein